LNKSKADLQLAEALMQQAKVKVDVAERTLQRAKKRGADKAANAEDIEAAQEALELAKAAIPVEEARMAQAKANLEQARINLDYTTIRSPVDGIVIDRQCNVGQTVAASLTAPSLFVIVRGDLKKLQVWARIREADIGMVEKGKAVTFTVPAYPKETFKGRLTQARPLGWLEKEKGGEVFFTVVVDVDNSDGKLLPHMSAAIVVPIADKKDVLQVPNAALRWLPRPDQLADEDRVEVLKWLKSKEKSPVVWVEKNGLVHMVRLQVGATDGTYTEVVAGDLKEGTMVVTGSVSITDDGPKK
jgi:HlyD family secretion protein